MRRSILVVDDDREMVRTLCDVLRLHGWEATGAYSGEEALAAFHNQLFPVVLMDIKMPGTDGLAVLRRMRAERPEVAVLLMTAYSTRDLILEAEREGAVSVLPKPVVLPVVLQRLEGILRRSRSVLVVDDDADFLKTLADALRTRGFTAVEAENIDAAVRRLEADVPAAVILHLRIGDASLSGSVLAIRRANPNVSLILYSGREPTLKSHPPGLAEGWVHGRLRKPFPVEELVELLNRVVNR